MKLFLLGVWLFGVVSGVQASAASITLDDGEDVRFLKSNVLELAAHLPKGTTLEIPTNLPLQNFNIRDEDGSVRWSSNYYYPQVKITSIPSSAQQQIPPAQLAELNHTPGGLYIATYIACELIGNTIPPVPSYTGDPAQNGYTTYFEANGKPKFNQSAYFATRFGAQLNHAVDPATLTEYDRRKWERIFAEMQKLADRTHEIARPTLCVKKSEAKKDAVLYVEHGIVSSQGVWSIPVQGTSELYGFANAPCAEFVSEVIRQAYHHAGYDHRSDFNNTRKNPLIWQTFIDGQEYGSTNVVSLANYLVQAGWIPWEAAKFRPVMGAPMMHDKATTPGHTYLVGGLEGRIVVDNGSPYGKDLRQDISKHIRDMYLHGVFFLPPGLIPAKW